jgi:hypothetical protein
MPLYVKATVNDQSGIVVVRGPMEIVEDRIDATEMVFGDADFLEQKAYERYPKLKWEKEKLPNKKYIVKADQ